MDIALTFFLYTATSLCSTELFAKACKSKKRKQRRLFCVFAILIPSLLAGLRGPTVGNDTEMYISEYYSPGSFLFGTGFRRTFELGYRMLRNIVFALHMPYQAFFFVIQAATLSFLFAAAKSESEEIDIRVTMFVYMFDAYFQSFNMMRQALAVAIIIYACTQIARDKHLKSLCLIVLAALFHSTAWLCIAIVFVKFFFKRKYGKWIILAASLVSIGVISNDTLLQRIAFFLFGERAIWYTTASDTGAKLWVYIFKLIPIIILVILCITNYARENKRVVFYAGLVLIGYIIGSYGTQVDTQAQRIALYLSRLEAIVLGFAVTQKLYFHNRRYFKPQHIRYLIYAYYIVMYSYNYFYLGVSDIVPYAIH